MGCQCCRGPCTLSLESRFFGERETTAADAELLTFEKHQGLFVNGYIFQPIALEVQCSLGGSKEIFITRLWKLLCRSHENQRAEAF